MMDRATHAADDSFLPTRSSLLSRLKNASDAAGWQYFVDNYGRLVFQVCLRAGLQRQEAEDVVQETVAAVAQQMPRFHYDRSKGSFKGWLARVTRNHIADFLERKTREAARRVELPESRADSVAASRDVVAGGSESLDAVWDAEWREHLMVRALRCIQQQLPARSVQIFQMSAIDGWSAEKIAGALQLSRAQIYLARHRAARLVKREIARLKRELE
jgi:RNA polymerase sigma-70 factor (ECF subfamily)